MFVHQTHELVDIRGAPRARRLGLGDVLEPFTHHARHLIGERGDKIAGYRLGEQAVAVGQR